MTRAIFMFSALAAALATSGCGGPRMDVGRITAADLVDLQAVERPDRVAEEYRIGVGDKLNVAVFQVADLSVEGIVVDASGNVQLPLLGTVRGAGRTPTELSADITGQLASRYLRNPQVTVIVAEAASQKITVDGAVTKPGVYEMRGSTSLLQAVAMAEGPTAVADLEKVAVFRTINGRRAVAVFDLAAIRQGRAADPQVLGDDVIVVDASRLNGAIREAIGLVPALAAFAYF